MYYITILLRRCFPCVQFSWVFFKTGIRDNHLVFHAVLYKAITSFITCSQDKAANYIIFYTITDFCVKVTHNYRYFASFCYIDYFLYSMLF